MIPGNGMSDPNKSVFISSDPDVQTMKACSRLWENVFVFERFVEDVGNNPRLFSVARPLLEAGILKVVVSPGEKQLQVWDKIYYTMGKERFEFFEQNASKIVVQPQLPSDSEKLIAESTRLDLDNQKLVAGLMTSAYAGVERRWKTDLAAAARARGITSMPKTMKQALDKDLERLIGIDRKFMEESWHPWDEPTLRYYNRTLLTQSAVSSSVNIGLEDHPFYSAKLSQYNLDDAKRYLTGWEALLPSTGRLGPDDFAVQEILEIRKRSDWRKSMNEFAKICETVTENPYDPEFKSAVKDAYMLFTHDVIDKYRVSAKSTAREVGKAGLFTGISLIPVLGGIAGTVTGIADPILRYFREKKRQQTLPFFLSDLAA